MIHDLEAEARVMSIRAKQSQFHRLEDGQDGRDIPPFHYSIIPPFQSDAECATKPVRGGAETVVQTNILGSLR
jgi:hypothetical protein